MWLAICLSVVAFGLVLMVVFGFHAYGRFRRMNRFGSRAGGRLSTLADQASALADRMDDLQERSEALSETAAARASALSVESAPRARTAGLVPTRSRRR
ncbi:MAG: hypothetical protein QOC80_633 [Frankiaceae bacterium]|nr:hypothetical protein [Frankiaceae bacterium]